MAQSSHLDREAVLDLLYPPGQKRKASDLEEHRNPWRPIPGASHPWDVPLLRVMAGYTGSQPDEDNCMTARAARQRLTTHEARKAALDIHVNYKTWLPTPFISFTKSPTRIDELVRKMPHRGWHTLVAIDPKRRLKKHLPILDLSREMAKYGVEDPYGKSGQFYPDEYLCPWEVTGEEVIGVWKWNELTRCKDWYQEKIMPTFRDSRNRSCDSSAEGPKQPSPEPLSELLERLSLCSKPAMNDPLDPADSLDDSGAIGWRGGDSRWHIEAVVFATESEDEVDEANRSDGSLIL